MSNEKIQAELAKYQANVEKAIAKFPERANVPAQRLYTPLDVKDTDYAANLYITEGKEEFDGNIYMPDDLDVINLK